MKPPRRQKPTAAEPFSMEAAGGGALPPQQRRPAAEGDGILRIGLRERPWTGRDTPTSYITDDFEVEITIDGFPVQEWQLAELIAKSVAKIGSQGGKTPRKILWRDYAEGVYDDAVAANPAISDADIVRKIEKGWPENDNKVGRPRDPRTIARLVSGLRQGGKTPRK